MSTPQSLGREATAAGLSWGLAAMDLRQPQTSRRSWVVFDWSFKVLTPLQHGSGGGGGPGCVTYGMHGAKVCCTSGHEGADLASGMPKTKHIIAKQVTLVSIELAMIV